jgi:alkylation response protein AidB-like acyl-CoA dehydrogenase
MTARPAAFRPAAASVAAGLERIERSVGEIQSRAAALDAAGAFPVEDVALLRRLGALELFAGDAPSALELMQALRLVGRANLSLGRIFEGHVNGARLVAWYGDADQRARLAADLADGALFGVWNTEPTPGVTIRADTDGWRLDGAKSYATGAGFVDHAIITAIDADGARRMVLVDGADPERADLSAWSVRGMRATCSGGYDLTGMRVGDEALIGGPLDYLKEPRFSAGAWRFTAVQLGGVERVLTLLRDHLATGAEVDPVRAARFGEALAQARSAYLWVREAAERAQAPDAGPEAIAFVLMTRGVVERAGLAVIEAAQRTIGTKAFFVEHPIDQACRDLALYLRQPVPDQALDRAAKAFIAKDCWEGDALW